MSVAIIIATYGDRSVWLPLAARAIESARNQTVAPDEVIYRHTSSSLAAARNEGAVLAQTEWLIFLDADDELDSHYVEAMLAGEGDLRQPATLGVRDGIEDANPLVIAPRSSLLDGNHLVIGTMVRREQFLRLGGFRDLGMYEDWDLWLRCWLDGAQWKPVPEAIYRVNVRSDSRNNQHDAVKARWYREIRDQYLGRARTLGLA